MTDLRDRARDEADLRQRLSDLAATITTDTTWDQLQTLLTTSPPPRDRPRVFAASPLGLAAAASVIVVAAAVIVVAAVVVVSRHDDDRVHIATTTTTTTTSRTTTTRRPPETTTTTASATSIGEAPPPIARQGQEPVIDLPLVLDTLGFGSSTGVAEEGEQGTPPPTATGPETTTTTALTILPQGVSPDGYPIGVDYPVQPDWDPMLTFHQDGDTYVVDVWVNRGTFGVQHLDHIEVPIRPGQNCLVLGSVTTPLFDPLNDDHPLRLVGGIVTTGATNLFMTNIPVGSTAPVTDQGFPIASPEVFPGISLVLLMMPGDFVQLDAYDDAGNLHHTVTADDLDAFPDTC
jgi:hypothetical protein